MLKKKIKCLFGFHDYKVLGFRKPFYQQVLYFCKDCSRYGVYHYGINCMYWTRNVDKLPADMRAYIYEMEKIFVIL